jgi:hypothetical protein
MKDDPKADDEQQQQPQEESTEYGGQVEQKSLERDQIERLSQDGDED